MHKKLLLTLIFAGSLAATATLWVRTSNVESESVPVLTTPVQTASVQDKPVLAEPVQAEPVLMPIEAANDSVIDQPLEPVISLGTDRQDTRDKKLALTLSRQFYEAGTGENAQKTIDQLYAEGLNNTAERLQSVLAVICVPIAPVSTQDQNINWVYEHYSEFCESVVMSDEEFVTITAKHQNRLQKETSEVLSQYQDLPIEEREQWIRYSIASIATWEELDMLKTLIGFSANTKGSDDTNFKLGQEWHFTGEQGRKVQIGALNLYQCEILESRCGPYNILTLEHCLSTRSCRPGWSMRDFYTQTFSFEEMEQVDKILTFLRKLNKRP